MATRSARRRSALERFMGFTDVTRACLGPADHGDLESPVLHRHDALEDAAEEEVSGFDIELDSHHRHYAVRKFPKR